MLIPLAAQVALLLVTHVSAAELVAERSPMQVSHNGDFRKELSEVVAPCSPMPVVRTG
jgi:hypothetical protein